jgi:hypothetical protein
MSDDIGRRGGSQNIRDSHFAARKTVNRDTPQLYEFGPFRLEPAERKLLRGKDVVVLTPKAFDTLVLLVRDSGHLLDKEELIRMLWPDTFVEEGSLSNHIFLLRKALGEDPRTLKPFPGEVTASLAPCGSSHVRRRHAWKSPPRRGPRVALPFLRKRDGRGGVGQL